jgi:hypothetical protein
LLLRRRKRSTEIGKLASHERKFFASRNG